MLYRTCCRCFNVWFSVQPYYCMYKIGWHTVHSHNLFLCHFIPWWTHTHAPCLAGSPLYGLSWIHSCGCRPGLWKRCWVELQYCHALGCYFSASCQTISEHHCNCAECPTMGSSFWKDARLCCHLHFLAGLRGTGTIMNCGQIWFITEMALYKRIALRLFSCIRSGLVSHGILLLRWGCI